MNEKTQIQHFIVSVRYENFKQLRDNGFKLIGFPEASVMAKHLNIGDRLVLYIGSRKSQLAAILQINSEMMEKYDMTWDDFFPTRYETKPLIVLPKNQYLDMREIKNGLSFINPEITKFGVYFMSGLKRITDDDYNYLSKLFEEATREGKA